MDLPLSGAGFLNGITSNGVDTLYVSDFSAQTIYSIDVSNPGMPIQSAPVSTGWRETQRYRVRRLGNRLLIATWCGNAKILSLDLSPGATPATLINTTLDNLDGISSRLPWLDHRLGLERMHIGRLPAPLRSAFPSGIASASHRRWPFQSRRHRLRLGQCRYCRAAVRQQHGEFPRQQLRTRDVRQRLRALIRT